MTNTTHDAPKLVAAAAENGDPLALHEAEARLHARLATPPTERTETLHAGDSATVREALEALGRLRAARLRAIGREFAAAVPPVPATIEDGTTPRVDRLRAIGRELAAAVPPAPATIETLADVRAAIRDELTYVAGELRDADLGNQAPPYKARALNELARAYALLGGDLELGPPAHTVDADKLDRLDGTLTAALRLVKVAHDLGRDEFPPRLDGFVEALEALATVATGQEGRHL